MPVFRLEEARRRSGAPVQSVSTPVESTEAHEPGVLPPNDSLGQDSPLTREQAFVLSVRQELDSYLCRLKTLCSLPPDAVFSVLSMVTARLSEIRLACVRSDSRRLTALRTKEVDPALEECERQFRFHSRIQSVRSFEWEVSGKGDV